MIINIEKAYPAPKRHYAVAYHVPIQLREKVLEAYRDMGIKVRLRYRGPRAVSIGREMKKCHGLGTYRRTRFQAAHDCLLEDATHFSVYRV